MRPSQLLSSLYLPLAAALLLHVEAGAADRITLGTAGANAGTTGVAVDVMVQNDQAIHAFSVALTFDPTVLSLKRIGDEDTAIAPLNPDFFYPTIDNGSGTAILGVIFALNDDPFTRVELPSSPDTPQKVAVLNFDIAAGAAPGDYALQLQNHLGSPPVSNVFSIEGRTVQPSLRNGAVTVNNENILVIENGSTQPGSTVELRLSGQHPGTLQGFSVAMTYDKALLTFVEATYTGTAAALALGAQKIEFFQPLDEKDWSPDRGRLSVGAVVDYVPPFTGVEIPASPLVLQSLLRVSFLTKSDPSLISSCTEVVLHNAGEGSVDNIFIVDKQSFSPALVNGQVCFTEKPVFRRGFVNIDSRIDISDGIVILAYLFLGGEVPSCVSAADVNDDGRFDLSDAVGLFVYLFSGGARPRDPFTSCGADPTDDDLTCGHSAQCQ